MRRKMVFAGTAGMSLAHSVCQSLGIELSKAHVARFADNEVNVKIDENVRDADVFIINPTNPPLENLWEMVLLASAAHGSSAGRVTVIPTYLGYNRQDRKNEPRMTPSARFPMDLLIATGAHRVLLFDLHSEPTMMYFGKHMLVDHLYGSFVALPYLRDRLRGRDFVVASPDKGGAPRAEAIARLLGEDDFVVFHKSRREANVIDQKRVKVIGSVRGKDVLFVDDMIDTGGTLAAGVEAARKAGAKKIYAFATHGIFSRDAVARLEASGVTEVFVTDTIRQDPAKIYSPVRRHFITVIPIGPLIAKAINELHEGGSLSRLIPKIPQLGIVEKQAEVPSLETMAKSLREEDHSSVSLKKKR